MRFVACSGFPVPVSRYFQEFSAVEIAESELGIPGDGTVRRWIREAPKGYGFSMLAPKTFADANFVPSPELEALGVQLFALAVKLKAKALVFPVPETIKHTKPNKALLQAFVRSLPPKGPAVVLDIPSWKPDQVASIDARVVAAYDPLKEAAPEPNGVAYLRLPGPAGHRSRYDEASMDKIAEHCAGIAAETVFCVFRNIDMQANAQQLVKRLG
jgi:uncharacterized protein YecE (DUF72 family)